MKRKNIKKLAWTVLIACFALFLILLVLVNLLDKDSVIEEKDVVIEEEDLGEVVENDEDLSLSDEETADGTAEEAAAEETEEPITETAEEEATIVQEEPQDEIVDEIVQPPDMFYEDWNNDGVKDLVRKDIDGKFYVFPNYGTDDDPVYNESYIYEK